MKDIITKVRYKLFGKQIQKALVNAERAGKEAADYFYGNRVKTLESDLENLKKKHEREIEQLVNKRFSDLNFTVNPDDVVLASYDAAKNPVAMFIGGHRAENQEVRNLQQEVRYFKESRLWKLLTETPRWMANEIMFNKSETYDDMKGGKMMLLNLDTQEKILSTIEKIKVAPSNMP